MLFEPGSEVTLSQNRFCFVLKRVNKVLKWQGNRNQNGILLAGNTAAEKFQVWGEHYTLHDESAVLSDKPAVVLGEPSVARRVHLAGWRITEQLMRHVTCNVRLKTRNFEARLPAKNVALFNKSHIKLNIFLNNNIWFFFKFSRYIEILLII